MGPSLRSTVVRLVLLAVALAVIRTGVRAYADPGGAGPARPEPVATALVRAATPTPRATPTPVERVEAFWQEALRDEGYRIGASLATGHANEYWQVWSDLGVLMRRRGFTAKMLWDWMEAKGWPVAERERVLAAAGYRPPQHE